MEGAGVNIFRTFLGVDGPEDGPVALLGLTPESMSESGIVRALQSRLAQIAAHPEALSPEADEVRLALHAAAARLLDPSSRRQAKGAAAEAEREPTQLESAIVLTLASMGGWNKKSKERIGALAQAYGVPAADVVELAESLAGRPHPARERPTPHVRPLTQGTAPGKVAEAAAAVRTLSARDDLEPLPSEVDPGSRVVKNVVVFGGAALLGTAALIVLSVTMIAKKPAAPAPPTPAPAPTPVAAEKRAATPELFPTRPREEKRAAAAPAPAARVGDWDDVLREASGAVEDLQKDPEAAFARFEKVYGEMGRKWRETSPDGQVAGVDRLVEFLYRAGSRPGVAEKAVGVMVVASAPLSGAGALNADQVLGSAWSAGVLARVERERDLPSSVRLRVQEALRGAFPGSSGPGEATFRAGCVAALSAMPGRIMPDPAKSNDAEVKRALESWRAWLDGVAAVGGRDSPLYTRTVLLALDALLTGGADPTQDKATFESIALLATSVSWRKDDESRRWLLRWFEASGVTSSDLYAVTAALAGRSGAEGVDTSMVLSAAAGEGPRAEMRDRYAAVWGMTAGESRDVLVQRWVDAAAGELQALDVSGSSVLGLLEEAHQVARFNKAAAVLWAGNVEDVSDLMSPITRTVTPPTRQNQFVGTLIYKGDSSGRVVPGAEWVVRYLGAGHRIPERRELIRGVSFAPDALMAEVLVQEACRGSPAQVRGDAREVVLKHAGEAAVVHALLEFAPLMPITRENAALVEEVTQAALPPLRHATWRVAVRRALVERLLQLIAGGSDLAQVDRVSEGLAELYHEPAPAAASADGSEQAAPAAPALEVAVVQHRLKWLREAELLVPSNREPLNLAQVEQRRRARMELAKGRVQEFQAEQLAVCELMAYVCVAEHPARAGRAAEVLAELTEERRGSRHVFEQLLAGERARMKLWLLRMGGKRA